MLLPRCVLMITSDVPGPRCCRRASTASVSSPVTPSVTCSSRACGRSLATLCPAWTWSVSSLTFGDPNQPDEEYTLTGQATVAKTRAEVLKVRLEPSEPEACPQALEAIRESDNLVLGPGSWFTSVMPHLLVSEIVDAILESKARKILTLNVSGADETDGFSPARHLEVIAEHEPRMRFDVVLVDRGFAGQDPHLESFAHNLGAEIVVDDLAMRDGSARHDPLRLASAYANIMGVQSR